MSKHNEEFMNHVRDDYIDLCERGWPIQLEEYQEMRMNSFEREYLLPFLSLEALKWSLENCLKNCSHGTSKPSTYDESLQNLYVPELLRRLEDAES